MQAAGKAAALLFLSISSLLNVPRLYRSAAGFFDETLFYQFFGAARCLPLSESFNMSAKTYLYPYRKAAPEAPRAETLSPNTSILKPDCLKPLCCLNILKFWSVNAQQIRRQQILHRKLSVIILADIFVVQQPRARRAGL